MNTIVKINGEDKFVDSSAVIGESVSPKMQAKSPEATGGAVESAIPTEESIEPRDIPTKTDNSATSSLAHTPEKDDSGKALLEEELAKAFVEEESAKPLVDSDSVKTLTSKGPLPPSKDAAVENFPKALVKVTSTSVQGDIDVKPKTPISPIRAPADAPDKRYPRLSRRIGGIEAKKAGIKTATSTPTKDKVISLPSMPKVEPTQEKRIILKRRSPESYNEEFADISKAPTDAQPRKKHKPITWP